LQASLASVRAVPRTEVAATAVDALAAQASSKALGRLAREIRVHSAAQDLRMLSQLERKLAKEEGPDCETQRLAATAEQSAAREEVLGLQETNASLTAAVALCDAQMNILEPVITNADRLSNATTSGFANFTGAWDAGLSAATAAESELATLASDADTYVASENATVEGASLPSMIKIISTNVADLKSETSETQTALLDATATLSIKQQAVSESRGARMGSLASIRSGNATELSNVNASLASAWERLDDARAATDAANNCTVNMSLQAVEREVVQVAAEVLRPVVGNDFAEAEKRRVRKLRGM